MIEELLPACVSSAERREDPAGAVLFAEERALLGNAVEKRRNEFTTARVCAREALGALGFPPVAILTGERGEPLWPEGALGSITHCRGYRAAAVAHTSDMLALGIDAEPHDPLPDGLIGDIARPEELPRLRRLRADAPQVHWDRLLFSAKESVYKAWFPLARRWLGFEDALLDFDSSGGVAGTFEAQLLVDGPSVQGSPLTAFSGRWRVREGLVLTAIAWPTA
jgi:4'-phosphopantetheinyl transferase EntD